MDDDSYHDAVKAAQMLEFAVSLLGRIAFKDVELKQIILSGGGGEKQLKAYNLCDGTRTQGEIAKAVKLDPGSFSRTVSRWESAGIAKRLGAGKEKKIKGLYEVSK